MTTECKNHHDPDFIFAAQWNKMWLQECVAYCTWVLNRCAKDDEYKDWMSMCGDFNYDKGQAQRYLNAMDRDIEMLENPTTSSPEQSHAARAEIAQVKSWSNEWEKGEALRDKIFGDLRAPQSDYAMAYISPSVIANIDVPGDFDPWHDAFADDDLQIHRTTK